MATSTGTRKARSSPSASQDEDVPQAPQSTPGIGGGGDYSPFVWQQLAGIQKSLGAIDAKLEQQKDATAKLESGIGKMKSDLDFGIGKVKSDLESELGKIKSDLSEFKQIRHTAKVIMWMVGVACAAVFGVAGYIAKEAWSIFKPGAIQQFQPQQVQPQQPPSAKK